MQELVGVRRHVTRIAIGVALFLCLLTVASLAQRVRLDAQATPATPSATVQASATVTATTTLTGTPAGTLTASPTASATASATATRRAGIGAARATPTPAAAQSALPAPLALVVLPAPSVKNQLVGDVVSAEEVPVSVSYPVLFEDRLDFWMENVRDVTVGEAPGAGIAFVRFLIVDQQGNVVHAHEARTGAPFCAFPQPAAVVKSTLCLPFDFTASDNRWINRAEAHGGRYTLVAFAQGSEPDHKGTWTLPFELRLSSEAIGDTDGAVRFTILERDGAVLRVQVETFGFTPFLQGTHLHFYAGGRDEAEAVGGVEGVIEYPDRYDLPGAYGSGVITLALDDLGPSGAYASEPDTLCVAIAHPDESVLVGRGECVPVPSAARP